MYQRSQLENGIRVVTESMPGSRSLSIGILIDASPRDETPDQLGLAHLTEHALFQGTSTRDAIQIARMMDTAGGQLGGFTTRDYTCLYATVLDDFQTYALDLLGDLLLNSTFPHEQIEREKQSILREIEGAIDSPTDRVAERLKATIWGDHPLGRPVAGTPERVLELNREDIIYFTNEFFSPNRILVAAAGNVEHGDFVAQVRDAFWRMLGHREPNSVPPPKAQAGVVCDSAPVHQAYFAFGLPAFPFTHDARYALHVWNMVLGGGLSSRLFRRIRDEFGLVYTIGAEYQAYHDDGLVVIEGSTAPNYLPVVLKLTVEELQGLASGDTPIDEEELWRAKMYLKGQLLIGGENPHTRMSRLATQEFYFQRQIPTEEVLTQIDAVDLDTLNRLGTDWLQAARQQLAVAVVGPESLEHYDLYSLQALLNEADAPPATAPQREVDLRQPVA